MKKNNNNFVSRRLGSSGLSSSAVAKQEAGQ